MGTNLMWGGPPGPRGAPWPRSSPGASQPGGWLRGRVAVGTTIAGRPPHRSVRAELPHTAPTLDAGVEAHVRPLGAHRSTPLTRLCRSVPVTCAAVRCSPWSAAFPPPPPPSFASPLCSAGSQVLCRGPTPPLRARPQYGYLPSRAGLPSQQAGGRFPGSRACCFSACPGPTTTGDSPRPRVYRSIRCCLPLGATRSASPHGFSKLNLLAHRCLCLRFRPHLAMVTARLEVRMVRYSFPAGLFHPLQHAGLSRRSAPPHKQVQCNQLA